MEQRVIMNSSALKNIFAKEYEDFFLKNNLIVSACGVVNRWNMVHSEGMKTKIVQKLPTKIYMGVNIRKDDEIHLQSYSEFVYAEQRFEKINVEIDSGKEKNEKMRQTIKEKLVERGFNQWINISILSENERGKGTITASIEALLLSIIIHIVSENLLPEQLEGDFIKTKEYKEIYTTARDMLVTVTWVSKEHINTLSFFTACMSRWSIGISCESKDYLNTILPETKQFDNNFCLSDLNRETEKCIEYSIINFGGLFSEFYNTKTYADEQEDYDSTLKYFKMFQKKTTAYMDIINVLYLKTFKSAKEASKHPNDDMLVNDFFIQINRLGSYQVFLEKYMDLYRDIISTFKKNIIFEDETIGLIPISSGKPWWAFLCLTKPEKSRETLKKTIEELRIIWHTKAEFQYLWWEDGTNEEGVKIEQYIDKGNFSVHIHDSDTILECGCGSQECSWKKIIGNHRELLKKAENAIVFDCIDGKIYNDQETTNHNEILTQSGTVEIIKVLFEHMWSYVNNSKLPSSSYSKNKNDMVGKIIWPLQELVQKKFNKKLDLECTGSIVNFDLKLNPNNINIHLIKKIH